MKKKILFFVLVIVVLAGGIFMVGKLESDDLVDGAIINEEIKISESSKSKEKEDSHFYKVESVFNPVNPTLEGEYMIISLDEENINTNYDLFDTQLIFRNDDFEQVVVKSFMALGKSQSEGIGPDFTEIIYENEDKLVLAHTTRETDYAIKGYYYFDTNTAEIVPLDIDTKFNPSLLRSPNGSKFIRLDSEFDELDMVGEIITLYDLENDTSRVLLESTDEFVFTESINTGFAHLQYEMNIEWIDEYNLRYSIYDISMKGYNFEEKREKMGDRIVNINTGEVFYDPKLNLEFSQNVELFEKYGMDQQIVFYDEYGNRKVVVESIKESIPELQSKEWRMLHTEVCGFEKYETKNEIRFAVQDDGTDCNVSTIYSFNKKTNEFSRLKTSRYYGSYRSAIYSPDRTEFVVDCHFNRKEPQSLCLVDVKNDSVRKILRADDTDSIFFGERVIDYVGLGIWPPLAVDWLDSETIEYSVYDKSSETVVDSDYVYSVFEKKETKTLNIHDVINHSEWEEKYVFRHMFYPDYTSDYQLVHHTTNGEMNVLVNGLKKAIPNFPDYRMISFFTEAYGHEYEDENKILILIGQGETDDGVLGAYFVDKETGIVTEAEAHGLFRRYDQYTYSPSGDAFLTYCDIDQSRSSLCLVDLKKNSFKEVFSTNSEYVFYGSLVDGQADNMPGRLDARWLDDQTVEFSYYDINSTSTKEEDGFETYLKKVHTKTISVN